MQARITKIRGGDSHQHPGTEFAKEVAEALAAPRREPEPINGLAVQFGAPNAGWINSDLTADTHSVSGWSLSNVLDPFADNSRLEGYISRLSLSFIDWLERTCAGEYPVLVLDMEGPIGVLAILECERAFVCLLVHAQGTTFHVQMLRADLVRSFYAAIVDFWEGDALRSNWSEWAKSTGHAFSQPWSIRSAIIEAELDRAEA